MKLRFITPLLGLCLIAMDGQAGEPPPKMVPRPIPGLAMPPLPAAPRPARPTAPPPVVAAQGDGPERAHILFIRRRPAQPPANPDLTKAKEIKAPRASYPQPEEARSSKIRIIPKAEVPALLNPETPQPEIPRTESQ